VFKCVDFFVFHTLIVVSLDAENTGEIKGLDERRFNFDKKNYMFHHYCIIQYRLPNHYGVGMNLDRDLSKYFTKRNEKGF
jgi:hypothetical protein